MRPALGLTVSRLEQCLHDAFSGVPITTLPVLFEVQNGQYGWTNINYALCSAANGSLLAVGVAPVARNAWS